MIEAYIYMKTVEKKVLWKVELKAFIKEKEHVKTAEGIISFKEELSTPLDTIVSMLKKKDIEIKLYSNYKSIISLAKSYTGVTKFIPEQVDIKTSFSELEKYIEENIFELPDYLNVRLKDIKEENKFLKSTIINTIFFKAYLYFNENPSCTTDIPLFIDLKRAGVIDKEMLIEDIFTAIEITFTGE